MEENKTVVHEGIIQKIEGQQITVKMVVDSACAACHAKGICGAADSQDKVVVAKNVNDESFSVGERVQVELRQTLAFQAVLIGYLLPFVVLMTTFCLMSYFVKNELIDVSVSFRATILYYFIVWLFNKKIERKFVCYISKLPQH